MTATTPCDHENAEPLTGSYRCRGCGKTFDILDPEGDQPDETKQTESSHIIKAHQDSIEILKDQLTEAESAQTLMTIIVTSVLTTIATGYVWFWIRRIITDSK